jgi:hypothetical protein
MVVELAGHIFSGLYEMVWTEGFSQPMGEPT